MRVSVMKPSVVKVMCISVQQEKQSQYGVCMYQGVHYMDLLYVIVRAGYGSLESAVQVVWKGRS